MINNLFDAHVKEQMAHARPDVPPHIWDNILAKKERKKPVFWFNYYIKGVLLGLVLLIGAGTVFYFNNPYKLHSNKKVAFQKKINPETFLKNNIINEDIAQTTVHSNFNNNFNQDKIIAVDQINLSEKNYTKSSPQKFNDILNHEPFDIKSNNKQSFDIYSTGLYNRQMFNASLLKSNIFNPDLQKKYLPKSPFIPCPEVEKNAAGSKRYMEIYGGLDYVFKSLSDTANSVYLQQRKASTKYLFAYSAGVRYTRVFGSGMSFRTGINYSQLNEQFTSEKGRIVQNVYIINSNGDTTGTYAQTGTLYKTSTNKYRSIDIPVSIGYELGNGRLHSNVSMGAMINIRSSQTGFVLDKSGNAVDITSGKTSSIYQYKTKAGVSFIGAASVYYKLNDRLHLMAEPFIKLSLSPGTKAEISLKEKFHTAGIRLGLRMDF